MVKLTANSTAASMVGHYIRGEALKGGRGGGPGTSAELEEYRTELLTFEAHLAEREREIEAVAARFEDAPGEGDPEELAEARRELERLRLELKRKDAGL